jgi:DNA transposition AAA+ family ATPase
MKNQEKQSISTELYRQSTFTSQNRIAAKMQVSIATISQMINKNWDHISNEMWRKVKVNLKLDLNWIVVETQNYKILTNTINAVQSRSLAIGISEIAGLGKSEAYKQYARSYKNVIHIECKSYWTKKSYVKNLLITAGLEPIGKTEEMIEQFLDHVKGLEKPLIIIDQADKLKDPQLDLFMDFYNDLFGHCGFVLSGVKALKIRLLKGVQKDKIGYREIWSRIGSKFYDQLATTNKQDVASICKANGVDDGERIAYIFNTCEGDLRKVRREIEKLQLLKSA